MAATVSLAAVATPHASASLIIDLRATAINGQPVSFPNSPKEILQWQPGDVVTLAMFARVSGTNGLNDEGVTSVHGSIISSGPTLGNLAGGPIAPFADSGSQNGSVQDLDGDTDLDIGVTPNGGTPTTGYFIARASALQTGGTVVDANTKEFQIAQFTFSIYGSTPFTFINFVRRANAAGGNITTAAVWSVDGVAKTPLLDTFGSGTPVHIIEPEPSAAALMGASAIGLVLRRRRGKAASDTSTSEGIE